MLILTPEQRCELLTALDPLDERYDPAECMVWEPFHSPGYHTTLREGIVHPTRSALEYAVALFDSGVEWRRQRACDILDRVIRLQDQNPESRTYGLWSWFLEEPLEMMSPPDWNWADFNGTQLLQVALDHRDRLSDELAKRLDEAIYHAARSIQRRNMGPWYTNIALMGTYVTYVTAELYNIPDLLDYARARLKRFHEYTLDQDGFTEFNSPTYTVVALTVLTRMRMHIKNQEAQHLVATIHDIGWRDVARRFHPPTWQWAGPHSRCYSTLLRPQTLAFIQRACHGMVRFFPEGELPPSIDAQRLALHCPEHYVHHFLSLAEPRDEVQVFIKGIVLRSSLIGDPSDRPVIGTTHLEQAFTFGSSNRQHLWNQARPLVAYWGTAKAPQALQLRCLHDFYDYSSAQFFSVQSGGCLLGGVNFATDYGDTHPNLDKVQNATIHARDMRLRFELFNMPEGWELPALKLGETNRIDVGSVWLELLVPYAAFGVWPVRSEVSRDGDRVFLDLILYQGKEQTISFAEISEAVVLFALRMRAKESVADLRLDVRYEIVDDRVWASWQLSREKTLSLELYRRPAELKKLHSLAPTCGL